jgi:glycosyltransferase involved in cell wall biosynthesis
MLPLSVVVPATNRPTTLERCREALRVAAGPDDEVIVVDGPVERTAIEARNAGVARARHDVLVFVDADVEVHPDALDRIRAAFADPGTTAVFGSYDDAPSVGTMVSTFRNLLHHHVHQSNPGPTASFWTGLGAVRRGAFEAVGGFDAERYRVPSVEDIDLGRRLAAAGATIRLDPAIQGKHLKHWTLRSVLWTDFSKRGVPWVAMMWRARTVPSNLNLGVVHRASALASIGTAVGVVLGSLAVITTCLAVLVALNHAFYGLLVRKQGCVRAVAGVGLHALHHLVSVMAVPVGLATAVVARVGRDQPTPHPVALETSAE